MYITEPYNIFVSYEGKGMNKKNNLYLKILDDFEMSTVNICIFPLLNINF